MRRRAGSREFRKGIKIRLRVEKREKGRNKSEKSVDQENCGISERAEGKTEKCKEEKVEGKNETGRRFRERKWKEGGGRDTQEVVGKEIGEGGRKEMMVMKGTEGGKCKKETGVGRR